MKKYWNGRLTKSLRFRRCMIPDHLLAQWYSKISLSVCLCMCAGVWMSACGIYRKTLLPHLLPLQSHNLTWIVLLSIQTWTLKVSSQSPLHAATLECDGGIGRICGRRDDSFHTPPPPPPHECGSPGLIIPGTVWKCLFKFCPTAFSSLVSQWVDKLYIFPLQIWDKLSLNLKALYWFWAVLYTEDLSTHWVMGDPLTVLCSWVHQDDAEGACLPTVSDCP